MGRFTVIESTKYTIERKECNICSFSVKGFCTYDYKGKEILLPLWIKTKKSCMKIMELYNDRYIKRIEKEN